ncbi:MAG: hypothetical protein AB7K09_20805, partial [Planctomycetota bacterium]
MSPATNRLPSRRLRRLSACVLALCVAAGFTPLSLPAVHVSYGQPGPGEPGRPVDARFGEMKFVGEATWQSQPIELIQRSQEGGPAIRITKVDSGMLPIVSAVLRVDAAARTLWIDVTLSRRNGPVTSDARWHTQQVAVPHDLAPGEWSVKFRERSQTMDAAGKPLSAWTVSEAAHKLMLVPAAGAVPPPDAETGALSSVKFKVEPGTQTIGADLQQPADGKTAGIVLAKKSASNMGFSASLEVDREKRKLRVQVTHIEPETSHRDVVEHRKVLDLPADLAGGMWSIVINEQTEVHMDGMVGLAAGRDGSEGWLEVRRSAAAADGDAKGTPHLQGKAGLPVGWKITTEKRADGQLVFRLHAEETATPSYRMALSAEVDAPMRTIHLWMTVTHAEVDVDVEAVFSAECELGT